VIRWGAADSLRGTRLRGGEFHGIGGNPRIMDAFRWCLSGGSGPGGVGRWGIGRSGEEDRPLDQGDGGGGGRVGVLTVRRGGGWGGVGALSAM
jgi:hypothetical protein